MATPISILTEIPEALHESMCSYLDTHPQWDQDQVITVALSLFLLNNEALAIAPPSELTPLNQTCARVYLEALFQT